MSTAIDDAAQQEQWVHLVFTWSGKSFELDVAGSDRYFSDVRFQSLNRTLRPFHRVFDLKSSLFSLTNVPPDRQKILGLVKGKLPSDEVTM